MKLKKLTLISLACILFACFSMAVILITAKADEVSLSAVDIKEEYCIGETLVIPDATINVNGENYSAEKFLLLPDGAVKITDEYLLTESGNYSVLYKASVDGKVIEKTVSFTVLSDLFSVSSLQSSAQYGTNSYLPEDVQGVNLSLKDGDVFTYNKLLDVSNFNKSTNLIKFYVTPQEVDAPEFANMYVKLTDIYDKDNYITVKYNCIVSEKTWSWGYMYTQAAANGQDYVGLEYSPDKPTSVQYNGKWFVAHRNNQFGFCSYASFTGVPQKKFVDNYQYFALDYNSKKVYVKHSYFNSWGDSNMVTDLDESLFYGTNLWQGFTTGEVIMSVYFENYCASSANIFITEIAGEKAAVSSFKDDVAPIIDVDYGAYSEGNLPKAFINSQYKVFSAVAFDNLEGEISVNADVYYNYYSDNRVNIELTDSCFVPKYVGKYTLVYTATDKAGNTSSTHFDIQCYNSEEILKIQVETADETSFAVAEQVNVAGYNVQNNNGEYTVSICAKSKTDDSIKYDISLNDMSFVPYHTGIYEIIYTVSDYTHTVSTKYDIEIVSVDKPIIVGQTELPKYFIKGAKYSFENVIAYYYTQSGRSEIATKCFVVEDGKTEKEVVGTYQVDANNTVEVLYKATNDHGTTQKSMGTVSVVDVNYSQPYSLSIENYFQNNGFSSSVDSSGIKYVKENASQNEKIDFINKLYIKEFNLIFSFVENYTDFEKFELKLTDLLDEENVLKLTFTLSDNSLTINVNGNTNRAFVIEHNVGEDINVYYNAKDNIVQINNAYSLDLDTVSGLFAGFNGNFADLNLSFVGANGKVGVKLSKLLDQFLMKGVYDSVKPVVIAAERGSNLKKINSTITIKENVYFDLYDPSVFVQLSVTSPSENFVASVDGVELNNVTDVSRDYEITLTEYGVYTISYLVYDMTGNLREYSYVYTVKDTDAPEISLKGGYITKCKKGATVKVAGLNIVDVVGATCHVMVIDPSGIISEIKGSFVAKERGIYTVYYYVFDAEMNSSIVSYTVTVS